MKIGGKNKIIIIGGPTATGKTGIGFLIAKKIKGEIISADSRLFYKEITIGTDKPPEWIREEIPHYFIDIISIKEEFNVYKFSKEAFLKTEKILKRNRAPIIVGGSGLYLRSLTKGLFSIPDDLREKQKEVRNKLEREKTEALYEKLKKIDPEILKKIHPSDRRRIRRALEVFYLTGKRMSQLQKEKGEYSIEKLGNIYYFILIRDREEIYRRVEERIEKMLKCGWEEEVRKLLEKGYKKYLMEKGPIGYREIIEYIEGKIPYNEMVRLIKKKTKGLVKRQITWFKKEDGLWINVESEEKTVEKIMEISGLKNVN